MDKNVFLSTGLIQYVDDYLIAGTPIAVSRLQAEMTKHFKCKFINPKDFLELDLTLPKPGEITLSMRTFTAKMLATFNVTDTYYPGDILTPGRTDKKIIRGEQLEPNDQYRSK
jgi:hypothetical protein